MQLEHYLNIQRDLNRALFSSDSPSLDYALFNAIFSEQIEFQREHIEADNEQLTHDVLSGLLKESRCTTHNKVLASDYECASAINKAFQANRGIDAWFLLCSQSVPLSMHDDSRYIDDTVIANCPYDAQQRIEKQRQTDVFAKFDESEHVDVEQNVGMLDELIADAQAQLF
jgi:hypothetical protein